MGDSGEMKPVSDGQVRMLMEQMSRHGKVGMAAMKSGMDRKTARKYIAAGKMPSDMRAPRDWRTRPDPFAAHGELIAQRLQETPSMEALTLFEILRQAFRREFTRRP